MDFSKVKQLMDESVTKHGVPCSDIMISHKGEIVYRYMNGTIDDEKKEPIKGDEMYFLYSATKPITCTAALQLVEAGKLGLDDKVADYIPEFGHMQVKTPEGMKEAKTPMTIRHLFSMTSGLNYNLMSESVQRQYQENPASTTLEIVRAIAKEPLEFEPGEHFLYSLSHDVLAAVVEVASGMRFGEYVKTHILDVCGMERTCFAPNEKASQMVCSQYLIDPETEIASLTERINPFVLSPAYESGGAGLVSCVEDYIKFVTEMANGNRLLKKETIDLMRANQLGEQAYKDFQDCKAGYAYGLGVRTDILGHHGHPGEFGWDGAAGAYVVIDPVEHIGIFYATHIRNHGFYLYNVLHQKIRDVVYEEIRA